MQNIFQKRTEVNQTVKVQQSPKRFYVLILHLTKPESFGEGWDVPPPANSSHCPPASQQSPEGLKGSFHLQRHQECYLMKSLFWKYRHIPSESGRRERTFPALPRYFCWPCWIQELPMQVSNERGFPMRKKLSDAHRRTIHPTVFAVHHYSAWKIRSTSSW